jgi:beta-glucanase (GH16 family)
MIVLRFGRHDMIALRCFKLKKQACFCEQIRKCLEAASLKSLKTIKIHNPRAVRHTCLPEKKSKIKHIVENTSYLRDFINKKIQAMKKELFLTLLCLVFMPATAQDYRLVWQDEFNGSALDEGFWNIEVTGNGGGNEELQYYRRENISVGKEPASQESCLVITAKKESYSGKTATSGRINSNKKMSFRYGKIEARIKLPRTANGLWPAFWCMGDDYPQTPWPSCSETDILEMGSQHGINNNIQDRYLGGTCHWGVHTADGHPMYNVPYTSPYGLHDGFHLFTMTWDRDYIRMYLDDITDPYYEILINDELAPYFRKPIFVLLNLAVGGNYPAIRDINGITALSAANNYEASMYVDYLRIYLKDGDGDSQLCLAGNCVTGIDAPSVRSQSQYSVYPNPAAGEFRISGPDAKGEVKLYNLSGQYICDYGKTDRCNISGLTRGWYLVTITDSNGKTSSLKLIKR